MDVSTVANQSNAITAYTAQQQTVDRARKQSSTANASSSTDNVQTSDAQKKAKGEQVSFTSEALRLSAQGQATGSQSTKTVNQTNEAQNATPYPPQNNSQAQAYQTAGAQSVAQAINTYHNTFKI